MFPVDSPEIGPRPTVRLWGCNTPVPVTVLLYVSVPFEHRSRHLPPGVFASRDFASFFQFAEIHAKTSHKLRVASRWLEPRCSPAP